MEEYFQKGDLVKLKSFRRDTLFLVYTVLEESVKLYDCVENVFYPADPSMYVKKQSLILVSKREIS